MNEFALIEEKNNIQEIKETDGELYIKNYTIKNVEHYIIRKRDKKLKIACTKINGIIYITINGDYILDYKKILFYNKIEIKNNICYITNPITGDIQIPNCDLEIINKAFELMDIYHKKQKSVLENLLSFILH